MADRTHLHRAAQRGDIGAVRALVQAVDVNIRGGWRVESPLHAASRAGRPDVIGVLMNAGANTEVRDRNNDTPLLLAAWLGHAMAVDKLLASGARVDADGIPRSALHCACMQGHADCVSVLLRGGADEYAEDEDGNTPTQVIGTMSESAERAENVVVIHSMLESAAANRVWRRRGWLVLLRARDCAAAVRRPLPPPPLSVTTRGAARRAVGDVSCPPVGPKASFERKKPAGQPKELGTRGSRGGQAVGHGERKTSKRPSRRGGVRGGKGSSKKGAGKRNCSGGAGGDRSDGGEADRQATRDVVARLIGLGEEGAFRSVLSFL